jgi:phage-related protein
MSDKIELLIEATDHASSVLGGIGQSLSSIGKIAGGLALGGIAAMGAGLIGLGSSGLQLNNSMEKVTAQLNAFTKDGKKTADIIDTVRERAAKTPFEFDQMAKAAVALFPASKIAEGGLAGILEKAEILAASNPAEGLEGAAFALKEAVSGDFTSIIERFNLPRQFINKLKKEGVPDLEIVQRAMKEMGLDVDLVSNLANTAEGRWSTFKDTLAGVAAQATKPIFEAMSSGIAGVNGLLEANAPLLTQIGANIAEWVTNIINGIKNFAAVVGPAIMPVIGFFTTLSDSLKIFKDPLDAIKQSFLTTFGPEISVPVVTFLTSIQTVFNTISGAVTAVLPTLLSFGASVGALFMAELPLAITFFTGAWNTITTVVTTVINAVKSIILTWGPVVQTVLAGITAFLTTHGAEIQLLFNTAWNAITTIIQTAISTVTVVINALAPVVLAIFGQISTFLNAHGSEILGFLTTSWNSISAIATTAAELVQTVVKRVFGAVAGFIQAHGDTIQRVLTGAWNVISALIGAALDTIKSVISLALAVVNGDWDKAWSEIKNITDTANRLIGVIVSAAMDLITGVISSAVSVFQLSWSQGLEAMRTIAITAWDAIKLAIDNAIESAKTIIANGVEAFLGKFRDLRDKMSVIGQQLLEGMVQGIRDKVGWLVDEGVRAANAVLSAIKNTLGIKSPSVEGAETSGYLIQGLVNGISQNANEWVSAGVGAANAVLDNMKMAILPAADVMTEAMSNATQSMEHRATTAAQSIAASMIAAGQSISTTQQQLANFIQSGGIGGITGGTYTPSQAFQDSFRNQAPIIAPAPSRPSSVPKPSITNNTPINITITGGNVDRYAVEDGVMTALRRSGLAGRYS